MKNKKRLKPFQSTQSLIPIKAVVNGITVTEDNRFIKTMEILPINFASKTETEKNRITYSFERLLKIAPSNLQIKIICQKADITNQLKKLQQEIMAEDNSDCREIEIEYADLLKTTAENDSISRRFFLSFEYEGRNSALRKNTVNEIINWANVMGDRIKNYFMECGNEIISVPQGDENNQVAEILYSILNRTKAKEVAFSEVVRTVYDRYADKTSLNDKRIIPLTEFISPQEIDFSKDNCVIVDGKFYRFIYITADGYEDRVLSGWLTPLMNACSGIDIDIYLNRIPFAEVLKRIKRSIVRNVSNYEKMNALDDSFSEVNSAIRSGMYLKQGIQQGQDFYRMAIMITLTADSMEELEWKHEEYKNYLTSLNMITRDCRFQQEEAFISALPLCSLSERLWNKAGRNILREGVSSLYPFSTYELIDDEGIYLGNNMTNGSLVIINIFNTKLYNNANIFISGTTGSGKTYALLLLAIRMRLQRIPVYILAPEKEHEFIRVCDALGGQFIRLGAGSSHRINILEINRKDEKAERILNNGRCNSLMLEKVADLKTFFRLLIPDITYEEKQLVDECLIRTYEEYGITEKNDSLIDELTGTTKQMPIFQDVYEMMKSYPKLERVKTICRELIDGSAQFFNGLTNVDLDNEFTVIGLEGLSEETLPLGMFSAISYIWEKIRKDRTQRKAVFIDEYWRFAFNETAANYTLKISKTIRAYGGALILSTQQITDIYGVENGKYGEGVLNNCKIKIILKAEEQDSDNIKKILHLSEAERNRLTQYRQGESMLLINGNTIEMKFSGSQTEHQLITTDREELQMLVANALMNTEENNSKAEKSYVDVYESEEIMRLEKTRQR